MSGIVTIGLGVASIIVLGETIRRRLRFKNSVEKNIGSFVEPPPPAAAPLRPYEVFLSFRGEDVRNNFVSHLHDALVRRGIRTYFDETNLQTGQTIGPELIKAIEESSIAIVVLSRNYGSSTWCLDELVKIMECKKTSEIHVFPIFYDVDPSDVRKQKNTFFKAFSNHEANFKDNGEKVKSWRKALEQVAGLAGEDIRGKDEASCLNKIAANILKQLPGEASTFRKSLVGIESRISEIKEMMDSKPNDVLFIGLWGMGGIGKTTTANAIFEDCKKEFQGSCFLNDVRQSKNRMADLKKNILTNILKTDLNGEVGNMIEERLQFKKILLVIDDVDDKKQIDDLAGHCDWFGGGSRIIITTRNAQLLHEDHIEKYNVEKLPENEALHLFCFHAFKKDHPHEDFKDLALQVSSYADGLPLALTVLGCHLFKKERNIWEAVLKKLKELPNKEIISRLKISFDGLDDFQKEIFLDIACFFRGKSESMVEKRLESLGLHPTEGIDVLIQKSLINISYEKFTGEYIDMHDLLQEMGWYIVRQRANGEVNKYSRLWLKNDIDNMLSNTTVSCEAERICINIRSEIEVRMKLRLGWDHFGDMYIQDDDGMYFGMHFGNMKKLRFLQISIYAPYPTYEYLNACQSVGQLNNTLQFFSWEYYPRQSLPKSFHPMNLVQLHMENSLIKETPDFSHMPNLEVLNLSDSYLLVDVHPSLGDHMKIKHINLKCCRKLKEFPRINQMKSLEILNLSGTGLRSLPEIYGNLYSLRKLQFTRTYINGLPTSIVGNAPSLQKLRLSNLKTFNECSQTFRTSNDRHQHEPYPEDSTSDEEYGFRKCLNEHFYRSKNDDDSDCVKKLYPYPDEQFSSLKVVAESFPGLVVLRIAGTHIVRTLDFSDLPYLEKLDLSYSKMLIDVHASIGVHKRIRYINLSNCSKLEKFPKIIDMISLQDLDLSGTRLQSFPEITGNLNNLVVLNLEKTEITTMPWSIGRATRLKFIRMEDCDHLLTLPISFFGPQIQRVSISSRALKFKRMEDDEVAVLEEVQPHFPQRKRQLIGSEGMGQLPLAEISFSNCTSLEELPGFLLSRVESLIIKDSPTLTSWICLNLVDLLDKFQHLCHLQLHQRDDIIAFSNWDSMSDMLRKREKYLEIQVPGRQIPSWFQYKFSTSSVIVFLPPLSEWYTDKFIGFIVSGINTKLTHEYIASLSDSLSDFGTRCCCSADVLVMCIPIDNIRGDLTCSDGQKVRTLFELSSEINRGVEMVETSPRWGLSLLYSEGEVIELDPDQVMIVTNNDQSCYDITFKVSIGESRDVIEELYGFMNPISLASFQHQTHSQAGTSAMEQDLCVPQLLPVFPSGTDLKCYQEGEPSTVCYGKDGDSILELDLSLDSHMMI